MAACAAAIWAAEGSTKPLGRPTEMFCPSSCTCTSVTAWVFGLGKLSTVERGVGAAKAAIEDGRGGPRKVTRGSCPLFWLQRVPVLLKADMLGKRICMNDGTAEMWERRGGDGGCADHHMPIRTTPDTACHANFQPVTKLVDMLTEQRESGYLQETPFNVVYSSFRILEGTFPAFQWLLSGYVVCHSSLRAPHGKFPRVTDVKVGR